MWKAKQVIRSLSIFIYVLDVIILIMAYSAPAKAEGSYLPNQENVTIQVAQATKADNGIM